MLPTKVLWDVVSMPFKRSQLGLYQGKTKQYGNNVPFSKHKTRRTWLPNVQRKGLQSNVLEQTIRIRVTTRALKTIKKKGGLDNYLKTTSTTLLGHTGMKIRQQIYRKERENRGTPEKRFEIQTPELKERRNAERKAKPKPQFSLHTARLARQMAALSLGRTEGELASVLETIQYLETRSTAVLSDASSSTAVR